MSVNMLQQVKFDITDLGLENSETGLVWLHRKLHTSLLDMCPAHLWHKESFRAGCPMPILINRLHQQKLEFLHQALTIAINDIVSRWWSDLGARFPERMPLKKEEEELLKVVDSLKNAS